MLSPETVLQARYRIVRKLGQGGMGAVYEAIDERLDTVVALKETLFADEKLRKQFEREARLLARLHHPALPRVSDHFNEGDGQFLVMQYIAGQDFFEMLARRNDPFSQAEVLRWGDQLCDALDYLHTQDPQIIHRDIKPQNLKLTERGQAVLLDFGLAKGSVGQMSVVTTSASIFGYTPNYAPLEQVQGLGTDPRSDIYSLSATLFHLLTHIKPPDALTRAAAMVNGEPDPLPLANEVTSDVSRSVAAVLNKGMSQKRDDRYDSAALMGEALGAAAAHPDNSAATVLTSGAPALAAGQTVANQPTNLPGHQTRPIQSEAKTLLAADGRRPATSASEVTAVRPSASAKRSSRWLVAAALVVLIVGSVGAFYVYRARRSPTPQTSMPAPAESEQPKQSEPVNSVNVKDSPANDDAASKESSKISESKTGKAKPESNNQRTATSKQTEEKSSETGKPVIPDPGRTDTAAHENEREQNRRNNNPPIPERPSNDPPRNNRGSAPPRTNETPGTRTLPNGTRITTTADGTRIITLPNGVTRVIPPGEKPNRRHRP
jgi:eukaryotic-like serine/threonine-protein kinase